MLDALRLSPAGLVVPPRTAFAGAATAAAAMGAAIATLGVTAGIGDRRGDCGRRRRLGAIGARVRPVHRVPDGRLAGRNRIAITLAIVAAGFAAEGGNRCGTRPVSRRPSPPARCC